MMKRFFIHPYIWLTLLSAWITLGVLSLFSSFSNEAWVGSGLLINLISLSYLIKAYDYYHPPKEGGKKFLFSRFGYIFCGIILGLVIFFIIFNLAYNYSGWFDFRDAGFILLSYPLILITHFQPDADDAQKRLILYAISLVNLVTLLYLIDITALALGKLIIFVKTLSNRKC